MKKLLKALTGLLLCGAMMGSAVASEGYYGAPKELNANSPKFSRVVLTNYTWDTYDSYAEFQPTFSRLKLFLGRSGSGTHQITYDIHYPDTAICLNIVRQFDGVSVYSGCLTSGTISIGPYANNSKLPSVTVTK